MTTTTGGEPTVVAITGEVDASNAGTLRSALFDLASDRPALLVLDAGRLAFLDGRGLSALLEVHRWLRDGGSKGVLVRNPAAIVRRLLEITNQESLLEPPQVVTAGGWSRS